MEAVGNELFSSEKFKSVPQGCGLNDRKGPRGREGWAWERLEQEGKGRKGRRKGSPDTRWEGFVIGNEQVTEN